MFSRFFEKNKKNKKTPQCHTELNKWVSCLASYQDLVTDQTEMCRGHLKALNDCIAFNRLTLEKVLGGSEKTVSENQNQKASCGSCKSTSS